jgi:glycosyltransferase involved in cell wall biosynthesis
MRILIVTQYSYPEVGGTQNRTHDFAKGLSDLGHQVTVLTAVPNHPLGTIPSEYSHKIVARERMDGFEVLRVWVWASPVKNFFSRIASYLSFMVLGIIIGVFNRHKIDVVIASSPPLFAGVAGYVLSRIKKAKFILDVRDLWPAAAVGLGELRNPALIRASEWLETFLYGKASKICAMTYGFCEHMTELGVPHENIVRIPYGVTDAILDTFHSVPEMRKQLGLEGKFLVIYAGNHGIAQALPSVLEAASLLAQDPDIVFLFVGEGPVKNDLIRLQRLRGLPNVRFHPQVPVAQIAAYLRASDVSLVSLDPHPIFHVHIPSKLFDSMACGVPVLLAADGEAKSLLEVAKAGICVEPGNAAALADAIKKLRDMPAEKRAEFGRSSQAYVIQHYTGRQQCLRLAQAVSECIEPSSGKSGALLEPLKNDLCDSLGRVSVPVEETHPAHLLVPRSIVQQK